MSEITMEVNAGACMFISTIRAGTEDYMTIALDIDSGCPHVKKLAADLKEADVMGAIMTPITENAIFVKCSEHLAHAACPIPVALVKACEAAADMCLKKNVTMTYQK